MKLDFNNIDEVFKDGLEDFTEQPSEGMWGNISRKMLWHDILHLRFGNIPRVWLGSFAGFVVLSALLSFWIFSGDGEATLPETGDQIMASGEMNDGEVVTPKDTELTIVSNTGTSETTPIQKNSEQTQGQTSDEIAVSNPERIINSGSATLQGEAVAPINEQSDVASNQVEKVPSSTQNSQEAEITSDSDENNTAAALISGGATAVATTSSNPAKPASGSLSSGADDDADTKQADPNAAQAGSVSATFNETTDNEQSPTENLSPESFAEDLNTIDNANAGLESFNNINHSLGDMPKVPNMGRISFTTDEPVYYAQRPAERNFVNPPAFLNRGYRPYFSISAYYAPELTEYHRVASESRESSWLAGVSVNYNTEKYTIQTGLEYSRFDDLGDYMVNINSYDSIGFYEGISGFDIDPQNPDELIYHTHTVEVWDTVQHHSHQQTINNYSYLQIPVMFGYKAMESGIFSAHIKAGPSFSFLLNRVEPTLTYQTGAGARITSVDNFTASRLSANVQVMVSVALRLNFSERMGILVEPTYRYYLNSVYDVDDQTLKNPYGIGVRGGIFFNFK